MTEEASGQFTGRFLVVSTDVREGRSYSDRLARDLDSVSVSKINPTLVEPQLHEFIEVVWSTS